MASAAVQSFHNQAFGQVAQTLAPESKKVKHDVTTELHYHFDDGKPVAPFVVEDPKTLDRPKATRELVIRDITGDETKYTLDIHGFQMITHESKEKDFLDDEKIKAEYYPEVEQILKKSTGASRVLVFDHTIRRTPEVMGDGSTNIRGPAKVVHIDQTPSASEYRVRRLIPDEADELLKKRFQIINFWRPIKTILRDPLGVTDASSVPDSDLVSVAIIFPDRKGETYAVKPGPTHQWYFKYAQRPDEPLLIKCFDSLNDGRATRTPHSAFTDPAHDGENTRESIEVRALVFYDY